MTEIWSEFDDNDYEANYNRQMEKQMDRWTDRQMGKIAF